MVWKFGNAKNKYFTKLESALWWIFTCEIRIRKLFVDKIDVAEAENWLQKNKLSYIKPEDVTYISCEDKTEAERKTYEGAKHEPIDDRYKDLYV